MRDLFKGGEALGVDGVRRSHGREVSFKVKAEVFGFALNEALYDL